MAFIEDYTALIALGPKRPQLLDMWVIFVNISSVIGPVIREERKAPA
jgi:hypothetical protein